MNIAINVVRCGAVTSVGLNALQTCAAIRAGISGFGDAYPLPPPEEPIVGARIPASKHLKRTQVEWIVNLGVRAIRECLGGHTATERTALFVNLPEPYRNHPALSKDSADEIMGRIQSRLGVRFHRSSRAIQEGHAGGIRALEFARGLLADGRVDYCLIGGIDSLLNPSDVQRLLKTYRIHGYKNSQGLIPGEGAAFVLITISKHPKSESVYLFGVGASKEEDTVLSSRFSQGRGLLHALSLAVQDAGAEESNIHFRVSDMNGERYRALESVLAEARFYQTRREHFPCWYTSASVGDLGAAASALLLVVAVRGITRGYAPGSIAMCESGSDEGLRVACLVGRM